LEYSKPVTKENHQIGEGLGREGKAKYVTNIREKRRFLK
jgi:hypothetical protein